MVSSFGVCDCDEQRNQMQLMEEKVSLGLWLQSVMTGNQGRHLKQESGGRDWGRVLLSTFLSMSCSARFLIALRTTCPEVASPTVGWTLPHQ